MNWRTAVGPVLAALLSSMIAVSTARMTFSDQGQSTLLMKSFRHDWKWRRRVLRVFFRLTPIRPCTRATKSRSGKNSRAAVRLSDLSVIREYELTTTAIRPSVKPQQRTPSSKSKSGSTCFFNCRTSPTKRSSGTPSSSGAIRGDREFALPSMNTAALGWRCSMARWLFPIQFGIDSVNDSGEQGVIYCYYFCGSGKGGTTSQSRHFSKRSISFNGLCITPAILDTDELEMSADTKQGPRRFSHCLPQWRSAPVH